MPAAMVLFVFTGNTPPILVDAADHVLPDRLRALEGEGPSILVEGVVGLVRAALND